MTAPRSAQRGFTLIEVLVALVLLSLLSLISWRGLDALSHAGERLDAQAGETQALMQGFGQLARDLRLQAGPDVLAAWPLALDRPPIRIQLLPRTPGMSWDPADGLQLVRSAGGGLWQRVHWFTAENALYRAVGQPAYHLPLPAPGTPVRVLDQVADWSLRVWRPRQGWTDARAIARRPADAADAPPVAAPDDEGQIGLEFVIRQGSGRAVRDYRSVVLLP
ncbi:prepilin-type N-terminal cleavage/methylation domain-containing protein [Castellaniella hirudinis]|uniref:prepilin-type N-terminal cleavage/methylation domain-containing protein n=1 Tax=Castellaniella hirudinis TaxID=1144617 RepID=UPI0039C4193A